MIWAACVAAVAALGVPATAPAAPATNGIYSVDINSSGNFSANTAGNHPAGANLRLTYPNGGRWLLHSYTSNTDYRLADNGTPGSPSDIANGRRFQYQPLATDSLDVRQDVTVSGTSVSDSVVRVSLRVQNTGQTPVTIGVRAAVDFMLATDDGPRFTPEGGAPLTAAQRYVNPTFATFTLEDDNMGSPTLRGVWTVASTGLGTTRPDVLEMADCCQGSSAPLLVSLPLSSSSIADDNEVRWIWGHDAANGRALAPGESATFAIASALSDAAGSGPPVNDVAPAISGTTTEGQTLTGTSGTWTSGPMTSYTYQWQRCDALGANCVDVAAATDAQYTLTATDVGSTMRLRVTADGTVSAESAPTAVIVALNNEAPETPQPPSQPTDPGKPKAPTFTATIGDTSVTTGGAKTSGTTIAVTKHRVNVGCRMTGVALSSCRVELYRRVAGHAVAARRVLVGSGTATAAAKTGKLAVRVKLNATGRALLRRSPAGLEVAVEITGEPVSGEAIKATGTARLAPKRATVVIGGFDDDSAVLTKAAERKLRVLARGLGEGARVRIAGHTDNSARSATYLHKLGMDRAKTVRRFLATRGATVRSYGAERPRATNATSAGRALNRRVVLTIVR